MSVVCLAVLCNTTRSDDRVAPPALTSEAPVEITKYAKPTVEESAQAMKEARENFLKYADELHLNGAIFETRHFIIWSDWDAREIDFLKENLEGAYAAVSRQFDLPVSDNIFVGKLPIYMFNSRDSFQQFGVKFDSVPNARDYAGYYRGRTDGSGHMAMWKPDPKMTYGSIPLAKRVWAYTLTHEFTHAFIARYISNAQIPVWLNEGVAEVIASETFPHLYSVKQARDRALSNDDISAIFTDRRPSGEWYPVMHTLTETLILKSRRSFIDLFMDLKNGKTEEEALHDRYGWDHETLTKYWRKYMAQRKTE